MNFFINFFLLLTSFFVIKMMNIIIINYVRIIFFNFMNSIKLFLSNFWALMILL